MSRPGKDRWVPTREFNPKRAEILERFLARGRIQGTDCFADRYERQARHNLGLSVRKLRGVAVQPIPPGLDRTGSRPSFAGAPFAARSPGFSNGGDRVTSVAMTPSTVPHSRREFLATATLTAGALGLGLAGSRADEPAAATRFPLIGFSKPFQKLPPEQTAELVEDVGWDGIEIPVRAKGQVEPERAPEELPRFAEALRRRKRDIHLVATDITSLKTPHTETVLRTMAGLGIRRLRLGFFGYPPDLSPADRLKEIAPALRDIAGACKDLGLQAGFQNHSGARSVGAPVWDVYSMIQSLDPRHIGFCFDIGHATVEGGLSWPIEARLAEPFYTAVIVKDFYWKKEAGGWKDSWCPLGEGMVNRAFFDRLKKSAYRGPICQHHEYDIGEGPRMIASLRHDLKVLKEWLG